MDYYAVMGNPIHHSKSPIIHKMFAEQTGQQLQYDAILVPLDDFAVAVSSFQDAGGKGLNVTVPFKQQAYALMDECSERAEQAKAVNTIIFQADGKRVGDNTDGVGLVRDLKQNYGYTIHNKRVLMLGAGGAARGVLGPLLAEAPAEIIIANRTVSKAQELVKEFSSFNNLHACSFPQLKNQSFDLVINATTASLQGSALELPDHLLTTHACCYDMMYGKEPTPFLRWAKQHGAELTLDGLGMLVEQAAEAFFLWRGVRPVTHSVINFLK